jgi:hypothetical protein
MCQNLLILLICILVMVLLYNLKGVNTVPTLISGIVGGLLIAKYSDNISQFYSPNRQVVYEPFKDTPPIRAFGRDVIPPKPLEPDAVPVYNNWNGAAIDRMGLYEGDKTEEGKPMSGDDQLCTATRSMNEKNKQSILNRARYNSENHKINFTEELDTKEHLIWWENNDHLDSQMVKDGVQF